MDMGAASVLPLKSQPVVSCSKDSYIESPEELHNSVVEEPVSKSWVLNDCLGSGSPGVRVVRTDEASQFWPLEVCSTVCEEDGGQTQCVHHGEQTTPLTLPVLLHAT